MAAVAPAVTPGGRLLPRPLRPAERVLDIDAILHVYEVVGEQITRVLLRRRRRVIGALLDGRPPASDPVALRHLAAWLWTLYEMGRWNAAAELNRLGIEPYIDDSAWKIEPARGFARRPSAGSGEQDVDGVISRVSDWADRQLRSGVRLPPALVGVTGEAVAGALVDDVRMAQSFDRLRGQGKAGQLLAEALMEEPGVRSVTANVLSKPFDAGLADTYAPHEDSLGGWEYSAVLDGGTCDICAPLDGSVYRTLRELYAVLPEFGPNPGCRGRGRCRCRGIPLPPDTGPGALGSAA